VLVKKLSVHVMYATNFSKKKWTGSFISYFFTYLLAKILLSLHLERLNICTYEYFYMKICICIINNFYRYSSLSAFSKELYCNTYVCLYGCMDVCACMFIISRARM